MVVTGHLMMLVWPSFQCVPVCCDVYVHVCAVTATWVHWLPKALWHGVFISSHLFLQPLWSPAGTWMLLPVTPDIATARLCRGTPNLCVCLLLQRGDAALLGSPGVNPAALGGRLEQLVCV